VPQIPRNPLTDLITFIAIETADESSDDDAYLIPSGNSSYLCENILYSGRTYEEQLAKAAVGIIVRHPLPKTNPRTWDTQYPAFDEFRMELVCAKHSASGTPSTTAGSSRPTGAGSTVWPALSLGLGMSLVAVFAGM
jgi:hypothetical protein